MNVKDRIIGRFQGHERGPLFIVFGGIHGNEIAGIQAIQIILRMLEVEPLTNPDFKYKGRFVGMAGNLAALKENKRYINQDMNRMWDDENVTRILSTDLDRLENEEREIALLMRTIKKEIDDYKPDKVYFLDIHTTTAYGGIFTLPSESEESLYIAKQMHAPVILGFLKNISGTTLHYFNTENMGIDTTIVTFEGGQHYEVLSIYRSVSAIANYMRSIHSVRKRDVESHHDDLLKQYAEGLPQIAELIYKHPIEVSDSFKMEEGFHNFEHIEKGELLARDKNGEIHSPYDGMILMPLYQEQGNDGFFIIRDISEKKINSPRNVLEHQVN